MNSDHGLSFTFQKKRKDILVDIMLKLFIRITSALARKAKNKYTPLAIYTSDTIGNVVNLTGGYELNRLNALLDISKVLKPDIFDKTAIDCGANIGTHSIVFASRFSLVHSFEPNDDTFDILELNTKKLENINRYNLAVSDSARLVSCSSPENNKGGSMIAPELEGKENNIQAVSLDDLRVEDIGLIKLDIEGHEIQALVGAERLIKKHKPIILIEQRISDFNTNNNGSTKSLDYLKERGYVFIVSNDASTIASNRLRRFASLLSKLFFPANTKYKTTNNVKPGNYDMIMCVHTSLLAKNSLA